MNESVLDQFQTVFGVWRINRIYTSLLGLIGFLAYPFWSLGRRPGPSWGREPDPIAKRHQRVILSIGSQRLAFDFYSWMREGWQFAMERHVAGSLGSAEQLGARGWHKMAGNGRVLKKHVNTEIYTSDLL